MLRTLKALLGSGEEPTAPELREQILATLAARLLEGAPLDDVHQDLVRELPRALGGVGVSRSAGGALVADGPLDAAAERFLGRIATLLQARVDRTVDPMRSAQRRRLEVVGRLAGGVTHDFNNVLTVILTTASMLERERGLTERAREDVGEIARAAERGAALTRQLLAFTRQRPIEVGVVPLGRVVRDLEEMLRRLIREHVTLVIDVADDAEVVADAGQLEQVVTNLVVNARDALPDGGSIKVCVGRRVLDAPSGAIPAGEWVRLVVHDDGVGMDAETRARMFEPFYSRKEHGTGLGLSNVQEIVRAASGHVLVDSAPGAGCRVEVWMPAANARRAHAPAPVGSPAEVPGGPSGVVLVVEDELEVLEATRRLLEGAGYRVLVARSAIGGLAIGRSRCLDLLVTDLRLPDGTGLALLEALRSHHPSLPAVIATGHPEELGDAVRPDLRVVAKPWVATELLDALRALLEVDGTLDDPPSKCAQAERVDGLRGRS